MSECYMVVQQNRILKASGGCSLHTEGRDFYRQRCQDNGAPESHIGVCWLFDSMWMSEKGPRHFTDLVFQTQVKEMLSGNTGNQPGPEPGSQLWVSVGKQNLPFMLLCAKQHFVTRAGNLRGSKHWLVTNTAHLCVDGCWLTGWMSTTPSAVLHVPVP